jgi:hypothetical protein
VEQYGDRLGRGVSLCVDKERAVIGHGRVRIARARRIVGNRCPEQDPSYLRYTGIGSLEDAANFVCVAK